MNNPYKNTEERAYLPTVTVGIPSHNGGRNIESLLQSLFLQKGNYNLKEVFVVCDGCTDDTQEKAERVSLKFPGIIQVLNDHKRIGKVGRLSEMFSMATGDIFVQFDDDIVLLNTSVVDEIVRPIFLDEKVGLTFGNCVPLPPKTFVESMMSFELRAWERALQLSTSDTDFHRCIGRARAFSRHFYRNFPIPNDAGSNEDAFSFLFAKENGHKTAYTPKSIVLFRLPSTVADYITQMARFIKAENHLNDWFKTATIQEFTNSVSMRTKLKALCLESFHSPISESASFLFLHSIAIVQSRRRSTVSGMFWETIKSSKRL